MNETKIIMKEKPALKNPILVVGLPGIGNVGRMAVGYLVHELKAKKFAELYSPHFFHFVMLNEEVVHVLRNEFYFYKGKERDIVFLIGDCQAYDPKGNYEVAGKILDCAKELGCGEVITIGGFASGKPLQAEGGKPPGAGKSRVIGAVSDSKISREYEKFGVDFKIAGEVGTIVGATGLLVGLSRMYNMKGLCLLGETAGFPIITDPNAAEAVLNILQKIIGTDADVSKLQEKVREMHGLLRKMEEIQREAMEQMKPKPKKLDELRYIG
ncbi:MAG: proteasome assembly chaperone family protein [Nanoarchaeota archaeon]|nr:proteasome assembly chaperone family protein [Nanoarchaeota archaeon]